MSQLSQNTLLSEENTQSRLKEIPEGPTPAPEGGESKADPFEIFSDALPQELRATRQNSRHQIESDQQQQPQQQDSESKPLLQSNQLQSNQLQQPAANRNNNSPSARSRNRPSPRMYRRVSSTITSVTPVEGGFGQSLSQQSNLSQQPRELEGQSQQLDRSSQRLDQSTEQSQSRELEGQYQKLDQQSQQSQSDRQDSAGRSSSLNPELESQEQNERDQIDDDESKERDDLDNQLRSEPEKKKEPSFFSKIAAHIHLPLLHHHTDNEDVNRGNEDNQNKSQ
jgi:Ca-activated chloride channel family protein